MDSFAAANTGYIMGSFAAESGTERGLLTARDSWHNYGHVKDPSPQQLNTALQQVTQQGALCLQSQTDSHTYHSTLRIPISYYSQMTVRHHRNLALTQTQTQMTDAHHSHLSTRTQQLERRRLILTISFLGP